MKGASFRETFIDRTDPDTGRTVRQLTSSPGNHHHLYFTSNSFNKNNDTVLFISDRSNGHPNLFKLNLVTGETVQLTDNRDGYLLSYVYYDGNPYRGLGKASPSFEPSTGQLLYIQGNEVRLLHVETLEERVIYTLPGEVMTGFTHLSSDGRYACVPYISAEAFRVPPGNEFHHIRDKVMRERLESHVLVIDTETGEGDVRFAHQGWITHVQFHPKDPSQILFNHEGGRVAQRIWLYKDGKIRKIRDQSPEGLSIWVCHEMWQRDGHRIIYHGSKTVDGVSGVNFVGMAQLDGAGMTECDGSEDEIVELHFPQNMRAYGHFTVSSDDERLVTDGVIDSSSIHLVRAGWENRELSWELLCRHHSSFSVQDVHPHPIFSHDDRYVLFTSDAHNERSKGNLYLVEL